MIGNVREAQRIVKLFDNVMRISPKKAENANKEIYVNNFLKIALQIYKHLESREKQNISNISPFSNYANKENAVPSRSLTPNERRSEAIMAKKELLNVSSFTPNSKSHSGLPKSPNIVNKSADLKGILIITMLRYRIFEGKTA